MTANSAIQPAALPSVLEYARYTRQLHDLIASGKGDSAEAEDLADCMDGPWYAMTAQEQARVGGLSEDLYSLHEGGPKRIEMSADELRKWRDSAHATLGQLESGDVDAALTFLRQASPADIPAWVIRFLQAKCWEKLGDRDTAALFMNAAEQLAPGQAICALSLLSRLERLEPAKNGTADAKMDPQPSFAG